MAQVISLDDYRRRRNQPTTAIGRLDVVIGRLEPLVRRKGQVVPSVQRELTAIAAAVSAGDPREAAERAERLADLLEHPALGRNGA
ncbi:MAG: hypothetical protein M3P11_12810 [Actinomycetota bacterium]|jgi:hypothetical protein|nr:hypothetical protein [Actinomycetota bacterium]